MCVEVHIQYIKIETSLKLGSFQDYLLSRPNRKRKYVLSLSVHFSSIFVHDHSGTETPYLAGEILALVRARGWHNGHYIHDMMHDVNGKVYPHPLKLTFSFVIRAYLCFFFDKVRKNILFQLIPLKLALFLLPLPSYGKFPISFPSLFSSLT